MPQTLETKPLVIDHASNNLYSSTYSVVLFNAKTQHKIYLGFPQRKTRSLLVTYVHKNEDRLVALGCSTFEFQNGAPFLMFKDANGIENGWMIFYGDTKRELHGKTVLVFAS